MIFVFSNLLGYQICIGYACDRGHGDRRIALFLVVTEKKRVFVSAINAAFCSRGEKGTVVNGVSLIRTSLVDRESGVGRDLLWGVALGLWVAGNGAAVEAATIARVGESGEVIELSLQGEDGPVIQALPIYQRGAIRYFSAGVGLEERTVEYPRFPLKLVFTAGGRSYVAGVSITIRSAEGKTVLIVPEEQVAGPWLFVDLPAGDYEVRGVHRAREQRVKTGRLEAGSQKIVQLRWAEDSSLSVGPSDE